MYSTFLRPNLSEKAKSGSLSISSSTHSGRGILQSTKEDDSNSAWLKIKIKKNKEENTNSKLKG